MEVANWVGHNIHRTSQVLGLRSEASGRFEKGLSPEQAMEAQALATKLMLELTGARLADGTVDVGGPGPEPQTLELRDAKVSRLLGADVPIPEQAELLQRIGFAVHDAGDGLDVTVPAFRRNDVTREVDLIEEVARLWGLEKLPSTLPKHGASGRLTREQKLRRRAADALVGAGFSEAIGWSFQSPETERKLRLDVPAVKLRNPLSEDLSVMRTTLLGSLLTSMRHNTARGTEDVRLFEEGAVYFDRPHRREPTAAEQRSTPLPDERLHLAALMTGRVRPASWGEPSPPNADFFAVKAVLGRVMEALGVPWSFEPATEPFLHPGRSAAVSVGGTKLGWLGEIHPLVCRTWDIDAAVAFELDLAPLIAAATLGEETYEDVTTFPPALRDLAVVIPTEVPAEQVRETVLAAGGELLRAARVFDLYEGEQLGEGRKSLALDLEFRADDRTLTDEEVAAVRTALVAAAESVHGVALRG